MAKLFLLVSALVAVIILADSEIKPRIQNADVATDEYRRAVASIFRYTPETDRVFAICTASMINSKWLVTAAHCFWNKKREEFSYFNKSIGVIPGAMFRDARNARANGIFAKTIYVDKRYIEANGKANNKSELHDMAFIELEKEIPKDTFRTVEFSTIPSTDNATDLEAMAVGYGYTVNNRSYVLPYKDNSRLDLGETDADRVQQGIMIVKNKCKWAKSNKYNFCATDTEENTRVCKGDSGSCLFEQRSDDKLVCFGTLSSGDLCQFRENAGQTGFEDKYTRADYKEFKHALTAMQNSKTPSSKAWFSAPGSLTRYTPTNLFPFYTMISRIRPRFDGTGQEDLIDGLFEDLVQSPAAAIDNDVSEAFGDFVESQGGSADNDIISDAFGDFIQN